MAGKGPLSWAVGAKVEALYAGDGKYYPGVVQGVSSEMDKLVVQYDGYNETAEVSVGLGFASHLERFLFCLLVHRLLTM